MTYQVMADCIRSGQLSAHQVAEMMRDEVFKAWYRGKYGNQ